MFTMDTTRNKGRTSGGKVCWGKVRGDSDMVRLGKGTMAGREWDWWSLALPDPVLHAELKNPTWSITKS